MKPSIIYLTTLLAVAGIASAGDSKALLQKALFAEEVEQNQAKVAELYQRMIDQAESAPKQLAVARYHLAKLHLAAKQREAALAQLQALATDPAAPADWVVQAKLLKEQLQPKAVRPTVMEDPQVYERLKDKVWNWHSGDNLYDEPNRVVRFLPDGKLENALEDGWLINWAPVGGNRFQVTQREGKYWIYELSEDGKEAFAVLSRGGEDNRKRLCVHPTPGISIEVAEIETLNRLLKTEPDSIIERMIPFDLVKHNRIKVLSFLFDHGTPVDLREKGGFRWTPLMFAASFADLSTVKFLLDRGADVNALDNRNAAPLFIAAWLGDTKIASLLLDRGANLENQSSCIRGDNGLDLGTALHGAAQWGRFDVMKLLLDRGADINALSPVKHNTPLICALAVKDFKEANELINRGADPNLPLSGIANPLRLMASQGNKEMVRVLLAHGARMDIQSEALFESHGVSRTVGAVLPVAAREGRFEVIQILVDAGCQVDQTTPKYLETPLHAAALSGNTATCKWLLEKGANLNHRLAENIGLQSGWTPLHSAVYGESLDVMTLLLSKGASPAEPCGDAGLRRTPFHLAVLKGWLPVVKGMLAQPAYQNPEVRKQLLAQPDLQGNTALHLAVSREATPNGEMVKWLIASGAPQDAVNERQLTPRQLGTDPVQGTRDEAVRNALKE